MFLRKLWADSGPDPVVNILLIFILVLSPARSSMLPGRDGEVRPGGAKLEVQPPQGSRGTATQRFIGHPTMAPYRRAERPL